MSLDDYSASLLEVALDVVPGWIERCVGRFGLPVDDEVRAAAVAARAEAAQRLGALLALDVELQATNPLSILRDVSRHATALLSAAGVAPVARDEFRERAFPDDVYDLAPATWVDVDERLQEPGLVWSAFKAKAVMERHRNR